MPETNGSTVKIGMWGLILLFCGALTALAGMSMNTASTCSALAAKTQAIESRQAEDTHRMEVTLQRINDKLDRLIERSK